MGIFAEDFSSQQERNEDDQVTLQLELEEEQEQVLQEEQHEDQFQEEQEGYQDEVTDAEKEESEVINNFVGNENCATAPSECDDEADGSVTAVSGENEEIPGAADLWGWEYPEKDGLYDPALEKDACGVGFIVSIEGVPSHKVTSSFFCEYDVFY